MKRTLFFLDDDEMEVLPGRVPAEVAAKIIGFRPEDMAELARKKHVVPLGHPPKNGPKYYSTFLLLEFNRNSAALAKASDAIVSMWARKNQSRKGKEKVERNGHAAEHKSATNGRAAYVQTSSSKNST